MLKGLLILILWLWAGLTVDTLIANFNYIENTSLVIGTTFLTIGVYVALLHCVVLKVRKKYTSYSVFLFPAILNVPVSDYLFDFYHTEYTCDISESESLKKALLFLDKIEYDPQFMQTKPRRLDWCELGFDYESLEHFRLIIVDRDGRVRLND